MGQWAGSDRSDIFSYLWHLACPHVCRVAYPRSNRPHRPLPVCGLSVRTWWLVWRLCSRALALDCLHNASGPGVQGVLTSRLLSAGVPLRVVACVPWRFVPASHKQMHNRKKGRARSIYLLPCFGLATGCSGSFHIMECVHTLIIMGHIAPVRCDCSLVVVRARVFYRISAIGPPWVRFFFACGALMQRIVPMVYR